MTIFNSYVSGNTKNHRAVSSACRDQMDSNGMIGMTHSPIYGTHRPSAIFMECESKLFTYHPQNRFAQNEMTMMHIWRYHTYINILRMYQKPCWMYISLCSVCVKTNLWTVNIQSDQSWRAISHIPHGALETLLKLITSLNLRNSALVELSHASASFGYQVFLPIIKYLYIIHILCTFIDIL